MFQHQAGSKLRQSNLLVGLSRFDRRDDSRDTASTITLNDLNDSDPVRNNCASEQSAIAYHCSVCSTSLTVHPILEMLRKQLTTILCPKLQLQLTARLLSIQTLLHTMEQQSLPNLANPRDVSSNIHIITSPVTSESHDKITSF